MGTSIYRVPISCDCDLLRCSMHFAGSPTSNLFAIDVYSLVDPTLTQADTYTNHQIEKSNLKEKEDKQKKEKKEKEKEEKVQGETKTEPIKFTFGTTYTTTAASTQPFTFTFGTTPSTTTPSTTTPSTSSTT